MKNKNKNIKVNQQGTFIKKDPPETICIKDFKKDFKKKFIN
jgi:hypothetical protein